MNLSSVSPVPPAQPHNEPGVVAWDLPLFSFPIPGKCPMKLMTQCEHVNTCPCRTLGKLCRNVFEGEDGQ